MKDAPSGKTGEKKSGPKETAAKKGGKKRSRRRARTGLLTLIVLISLAIVVCAAAAAGGYVVSNSTTNLPNVYLGDFYVGGMTEEETVAYLKENDWETITGGTLTVSLPENVSFEADYLRAGASISCERAAEQAFAYGHGPDRLENLITYLTGMLAPKDLSVAELTIDRDYVASLVDAAVDEFEQNTSGVDYRINEEASTLEMVKGLGQVTLDREAITDAAAEALLAGKSEMTWTGITGELIRPDFAAIAAEITSEVRDAYYDPETDEIVPEVKGVDIDMATAEKLWDAAGVLDTLSIPITLVNPEVTAEELSALLFRDKLGDCLTYLWGSTANRISNIRLACSRFDGMVLMPGESFSYNDVVGERTAEAGFKLAPTYSGTAHIDGLGGGICQVSSTLYNAVQYANLKVDERVCHTMLVGYLDPGLDATVDWPDTNFVFTNDSPYPIRLKAGVAENGRSVTIEIWGTNVDGTYVDIIHGSWPAYDETYREQYGLNVQVGTGAWNFRRVHYPDGTYRDSEKVYSYYHIPEDEITWPEIPTPEEDGAPAGGEGGTP